VRRARFVAMCVFCGGALLAAQAVAVEVRVTIENLAPENSVALSPFLVAGQDGTVDTFDVGAAASAGIEDVAELGNGDNLTAEITSAQGTAAIQTVKAIEGGFGPGIFRPGAKGWKVLSLDPTMHRYLTYGAMVVPSNDAFLGNDSPTAVELFDAMGNFVATDFTLTGEDIWDAGTEVNQLFGAAYVDGQNAGEGTPEGGVVHSPDLAALFSTYEGSMTPAEDTFSVLPMADTPIASFSFEVVPEPSTLTLVVLGVISVMAFGRRRWTAARR
jgi:hypothetical protein